MGRGNQSEGLRLITEKARALLKRITLVSLQGLQGSLRGSQMLHPQLEVPYSMQYECPDGGTHATFCGLTGTDLTPVPGCYLKLSLWQLQSGEEVTGSLVELKADLLHPRISGISEMALSLPDTRRVI